MYGLEQEKFWAGTSGSYWAVLDAQERAVEYFSSKDARRGGEMQSWVDDMVGPVFSVEGNVGVINVKGSLVNGSSGIMRLYGVLGYDDIRQAFTDAVADKNVKSILMKVDSGGGQVAGCQELGNYIMEVGKVKPVDTFTDTTMASAAYWLGCAASTVSASSTATVGSIGVLVVHQEVSKMMADQGVTTTIVRSGKYKALVNRYEPLSDLAKEELQAQVDDLDKTFTAFVAGRRGVSEDAARRKMGQGREFLGARALDAGLVDSITTFSEAHAKASASNGRNARKPVASAGAAANNATNVHEGTNQMKVNLTAAQLASLAAGTPLDQLGLKPEELAALQEAQATAKAEAAAAEAAAAEAAAKPPATAPATAPAAASNDTLVSFLRGELRETQAALAAAQVSLTAAEAKATAAAADRTDLLKIARGSVGNMQVALGGRNTADVLADADVLAEHTRMAAEFTKRLPVGRVSAAASETTQEAAKIDPAVQAALASARTQF